METVTIQVKGMSCEHCQAAVEGALGGLTGVASAKVDPVGGTAKVFFDGMAVEERDFRLVVEEAGFEVI